MSGLTVVKEGEYRHYDHTGSRQVDTHSARLRGKLEDWDAVIFRKLVDEGLARIDGRRASQYQEFHLLTLEHALQDVENLRELHSPEDVSAMDRSVRQNASPGRR